jgi:hypothetical protein
MKMIKNIILIAIILLSPTLTFGQESEMEDLIIASDSWGKEFFQFPISFAQEINFKGMEDARFPKGWAKIESPEFWSYAFAWEVDADQPITKTALESSLQLYFDGLLGIDILRKNDANIQKTKALFIEKETTALESKYIGKIDFFESRITKKPMTLNVTIEQHYCKSNQKAVILFKFSPKEFEHDTWAKLAEVTLRKDLCK